MEQAPDFVSYLDSYAKLLAISGAYLRGLAELESTNQEKFSEFKEILQSPEKLIEFAAKESPEFSKIIAELFTTIGSLSAEKNPMDLTPEEKRMQATKFEEASKKILELSKQVKEYVKKSGEKNVHK